jgi:hypothetical protein
MDFTNRTDWALFTRLDNASIVDFLSSSASVLLKHGTIGQKESDNLRLVLSGIQSNHQPQERSTLMELIGQDAEILGILAARYGDRGLGLNILRHGLKSHVAKTRQVVSALGEEILKKSELLFNRPIDLYDGTTPEHRTLFSTLLIDFSDLLSKIEGNLSLVESRFSVMEAASVAPSEDGCEGKIDQETAQCLGFTSVSHQSFSLNQLSMSKALLARAYQDLADACESLVQTISANTTDSGEFPAIVCCDWLRSEGQRIESIEFPESASLLSWEIRRNNLGSSMIQANQALDSLGSRILETINAVKSIPAKAKIPQSFCRRLVVDLIAAGVGPNDAWAATNALISYLDTNKLEPKDMLVAELDKLHPQLLPRTLETLVDLTQEGNLVAKMSGIKTENLKRSRRLKTSFQKTLSDLAPVLIAVFGLVLGGCGLKTGVKNDILEPRPDIPYHRLAKEVDPTSNKIENPANPDTGSNQPLNPPERTKSPDGNKTNQ